jgi:hypothetical protein
VSIVKVLKYQRVILDFTSLDAKEIIRDKSKNKNKSKGKWRYLMMKPISFCNKLFKKTNLIRMIEKLHYKKKQSAKEKLMTIFLHNIRMDIEKNKKCNFTINQNL